MGSAIDLTGQTFGRLTVLNKTDNRSKGGNILWLCQCSCGSEPIEISSGDLRHGRKSCGCLKREQNKTRAAKHGGKAEAPLEYLVWSGLGQRNLRPAEWSDFVQFFCDVGERPSPDHYLMRRDVDKPYSKENAYWENLIHERTERSKRTLDDLGDLFTIDLDAIRAAATSNCSGRALSR